MRLYRRYQSMEGALRRHGESLMSSCYTGVSSRLGNYGSCSPGQL
jgi:hypothetical protein